MPEKIENDPIENEPITPKEPDFQSALTAALQPLNAKLHWLERQLKTKDTSAPDKNHGEELTQREMILSMQAEMKRDREELAKERRAAAISSAISGHGIDSDNAALLEDHLENRYGKNIKIDGKTVYFDNEVTGEKQDVKTLVGEVMKKFGDKFKAPVSAPSARGLQPTAKRGQPAQVTYGELSNEERNKMTGAQRSAWVAKDLKNGRA